MMRSQPLAAGRVFLARRAGEKFWAGKELGRAQWAKGNEERSSESSRKAINQPSVPLDISRTPCSCNSDQLIEFLDGKIIPDIL